MEKIKCWTVFSEEYPGGFIFKDRVDALENSREMRAASEKAYVRVQYFIQKELDDFPEAD
jgi:hypothetical protein